MTLRALSDSRHNAMKIKSPSQKKGDIEEDQMEVPRAKRQKTEEPEDRPVTATATPEIETPPEIETQAVDAGLEAAGIPEAESLPEREFDEITGTYKSSMYVDAFNLTLDTVLTDESYLFSEEEAAIFATYRSLEYEAQHLYVRLFLRKTAAWFRIDKLQYQKDIADLDTAVAVLQAVGFADTDADITLEEVAALLPLEELKGVAREVKCAAAPNKASLIVELKKACKAQGGLQGRGGQLKLNFDGNGRYVSREKPFIKKMLKRTGPCIRLTASITELFNRVNLVFYRSTEWSEKSLTTVILSRTAKRTFPSYIVSRTSNIFPTRQALLDFEAAIKLQSQVDAHLVDSGVPTEENLQAVRDIFDTTYPLWTTMVASEAAAAATATPDLALERVYLRRFNAAWVYTRIVHKGVYVLGRHKAYELEHSVLKALLAQPYFQPARRGGWYQRKALIEENYLPTLRSRPTGTSKDAHIRNFRRKALETCEAGLQDPQTHVVFHHDLQKRILKLEGRMKVPKRMQHDFGHTRLVAPTHTTVYGTILSTPTIGRKTTWEPPDGEGDPVSVEDVALAHYRSLGWHGHHAESSLPRTLFAYLFYDLLFLYLPNVFETPYQTAPLDLFTDAFYPSRASEINHRLVEIGNGAAPAIVKRVHDEIGETKPCVVGLNWGFDINDLVDIVACWDGEALAAMCRILAQEYRQRSGGMPDLFLWRVHERVGQVDRDIKVKKEDVEEDGNEKGGEEQTERGEVLKGECMFAEVKSKNDKLSDTQRLWIHVLSTAGVRVELCAVRDKEDRTGKGIKRETRDCKLEVKAEVDDASGV
ncbi:hypothetical protein EDC01DRAFT_643509 [Geopyxis carbonaria]|nr:hypothetical protein EDC01DRAFT_643509 [Geopyxis carbonaria]